MARTNLLAKLRLFLTFWLGYQTVKVVTFLHFLGKRHGYYDSKVAFVLGVQTVAPPIVVINVVTWIVFWFDKQQSRMQNWRTPEKELLWWLWTT
ncbi:726_t:CDS:2, partial [Acaulospora morrowiae]